MRLTVRLFAQLRELAGSDTLTVDVSAPATVADVWRSVIGTVPALGPFGRTLSCAVNAQFARLGDPVADGDDVAFLPPVAGG